MGSYNSRIPVDSHDGAAALQVILKETELHRRLTERWGISLGDLDAAPEKQATVAYTRYVLDSGMAGDLLDLHTALAPCVIGYAEIGAELEPALSGRSDHPYREWISEYAGDDFQAGGRAAAERLDRLTAGGLTGDRFEALVGVFRTATRLEADFWQQALDSAA